MKLISIILLLLIGIIGCNINETKKPVVFYLDTTKYIDSKLDSNIITGYH